jgi:hypothetical protein
VTRLYLVDAIVMFTMLSLIIGTFLHAAVYAVPDKSQLSLRAMAALWIVITLTWPLSLLYYVLQGSWWLLRKCVLLPRGILELCLGFADLYRYIRPKKISLPKMRVL